MNEMKFFRGIQFNVRDFQEEIRLKLQTWFKNKFLSYRWKTPSVLLHHTAPNSRQIFEVFQADHLQILIQLSKFIKSIFKDTLRPLHHHYHVVCEGLYEWNTEINLPVFEIKLFAPLRESNDFLMLQQDYEEQIKIDALLQRIMTTFLQSKLWPLPVIQIFSQ